MVANSQQFGSMVEIPRRVGEVNSSSLESQISHLTNMVQNIAMGIRQPARLSAICAHSEHSTDMCPTLLEEGTHQVNAMGGYQGQQSQRRYDPYSSTYNPGWRDHPNFNYGPRPQNYQSQPRNGPPPPQQSLPQPTVPQKPNSNLEDMVRQLTTNMYQFQQETWASIQNLENQMGQLATTVSKLESQGKLPSQTVVNPKQNVSAVSLRSGKELLENPQSRSLEQK